MQTTVKICSQVNCFFIMFIKQFAMHFPLSRKVSTVVKKIKCVVRLHKNIQEI